MAAYRAAMPFRSAVVAACRTAKPTPMSPLTTPLRSWSTMPPSRTGLTSLSFKRSPGFPAAAISAASQNFIGVSSVNQAAVAECLSASSVDGTRSMSSMRLRPYASAGVQAAVPLSSLSAGFSKVGLSLLVLPWKALPMVLAVAPTVWILPAAYRMIFQNSMRHTTAAAFSSLLYLVVMFLPIPCFENLFSELTFYAIALVSSFFAYTFFPEILLHDFFFMHYMALFTIPLIPLCFAYMPMFATRSYLFL
eukprot:TRINITY_DN3240_c0_g2_i1.p1 TRINITY_DN3240_c0_g2~~TRINITY_DN3240_c0_g2_i1.p1  ORF type:complete len:250 (+),score=31.64 TRINITY_DN3240_c0_g2_i1:84-833(+)